MKPEKIEIMPFGVSIAFKLTPKDYNKKIKRGNQLELKKILVALAGPVTNILIIFFILQAKVNFIEILLVVYSNLLLVVFNLLPIYPLDGGRIIKGILHIFLGKRKAEKYINYISFITIIILTFIFSIIIYKAENIAMFLIVIVLWGIFIKEDTIYQKRNKIYNLLEKTIEIN